MEPEQRKRRTRVIAIGNQKGGVGKTTNCVHVARALAHLGRKCLIFDLDMNHGATNHLGIHPEGFGTSYEVLLGSEEPLDCVFTKDVEEEMDLPEHLDIIAATRKLENLDSALREVHKMLEPHRVLLEPLAKVDGYYDYVFLDTAPNATIPTIAAYKAAEWFILSAMPETFAVQGLNEALSDIAAARKHGNPDLKLLGVILCNVERRTRLSQSLLAYVDDTFTGKDGINRKFKTTISRSTIVSSAQKLGQTIFETEPDHKVTKQYLDLALELEQRLADHDKQVKRAGQAVMVAEAGNA
ncbi:MAG: ParA family protein [Candidatus Eisenbacteria bacterium]|nr:ParA family protein [Candidatus Eisenbacteria bacterium]